MDFQIHLRLFELNSSAASIPVFKKNTLARGNIREFFRQRQFLLLLKKLCAIYNSSDLTLRLYDIHETQDCKKKNLNFSFLQNIYQHSKILAIENKLY